MPLSQAALCNIANLCAEAQIDANPLFTYSCPYCRAAVRRTPIACPEKIGIVKEVEIILTSGMSSMANLESWKAVELGTAFDGLFLDSLC